MRRAWIRVAVLSALASTVALAQSVQPRVDLTLQADRISMGELSRLLPALEGMQLPPHLRITRLDAHGPLSHVTVDFAIESAAGSLEGQAIVDATTPSRRARGTVRIDNVALAQLVGRPAMPEALTAAVQFNLRFDPATPGVVAGTFEITSPQVTVAGYTARQLVVNGRIVDQRITFDGRAAAYGADVTAQGRVSFGDVLTYDVKGSAMDVNLARLPRALDLPRLPSDVALDYNIAGSGAGAHGDVVLQDSTVAGATFAAGTRATFDTRGEGLTLHAQGAVADLNVGRIAEMLDLSALQGERFSGAALDATFEVRTQAGDLQALDIGVAEGDVLGGTVRELTVTATSVADALAFSARGRFADLDPGVIAGRPDIDGSLTGTMDLSGSIPRESGSLIAARVDLHGRVALDSSTFEGVPVNRGVVVASLTDGARLQVNEAEFSSETLTARAAGVYGFDPGVPTHLRYEISSEALGDLSALLGTSISGRGALQGTVTGTDVLQVEGKVTAGRLGYQRLDIRDAVGRFSATVDPDALAEGRVEAHVKAGELVVAAETLGAITADVRYANHVLAFDVGTKHSDRSLNAAGDIVWHADHQEVHLRDLSLATPAGTWQLAAGVDAAVRYGGDGVQFQDVRLVSGVNEFIRLNGSLDDEQNPLRIAAGNVQIAPFATLLGHPQLEGELNVNAVVTGELTAPDVDGEFEVRSATFRGIDFQSIRGDATLGNSRFELELRLVRPDGSWLALDGQVPAALVRSGEMLADAPVDVTVTSSPIDLQIVRAFTTAVGDVAGTLQIDATWKGSLAAPQLGGQIVVRDGAFSVPTLGTHYTRLDTTILLQPESVIVDTVRLVDDDGDWLTVSGRLPIDDLLAGRVQLQVQAESFEVVDNELADLEANLNLEISGNVRLPDVAGLIEIVNGQIHVDQILELSAATRRGSRPPAASMSDSTPAAKPAAAPLTPTGVTTGLFADLPLALNVHVWADALLLTGRDLRAPAGVPVGLGDINLVADGDLTLRKTREGPLRLMGDVEMVRGTYEFQNREFTLVRGGRIRFVGEPTFNPRLDITAERTISAVETRVHVGGTVAEPTLQLSSNPPLDQADILSMIVFNQPTIDLGAGARVSLAARATALGAGFLAGEISDAISDALGLDIVDIDAGSVGGSGFAPVVTVGEQFGDVFLKFRHQLGAQSASQVVIEYFVTDWFSIESSFVDRRQPAQPALRRLEGSGIDGVFSWEFGAPADPFVAAPAPEQSGQTPRRP